jgi:hypothetical protein
MALRKLAAVAPVIAVLSFAGPLAGANAQTTPVVTSPAPAVPCFPFPAFCNAQGQPTGPLAYPYSYLITLFHGLFATTPPVVAGSPS